MNDDEFKIPLTWQVQNIEINRMVPVFMAAYVFRLVAKAIWITSCLPCFGIFPVPGVGEHKV